MNEELTNLLGMWNNELARCLRREFPSRYKSLRLNKAMAYALNSSGKRLRPLLVMSTAVACRGEKNPLNAAKLSLKAAIATELVHTYSLIHDDLPAMDDDDFRRGRLTIHRRFDEGLAILAGDALLADAFYFASHARFNAIKIVRELSLAAGSSGLVAGQSEDLDESNLTASPKDWLIINEAKTARLFEACASLGAYCVDAKDDDLKTARNFGRHFGIAYQLKDDLEDKAILTRMHSPGDLRAMLFDHIKQAQKFCALLHDGTIAKELIHFTFANWV